MSYLVPRILATLALIILATSAQAALGDRSEEPQRIPLKKNLRMLIRPTLMGLVPPADPRSYGEMFLRVTDFADNQPTLNFEVKESIPGTSPKDDEATRIRRGNITVTGLAAANVMLAPMFWPNGDFTTDSGLTWVSRSTFSRLKRHGKADWRLDFALEQIPAEFHTLNDLVAQLTPEDTEAGVIELKVDDDEALYPCEVNGERTQLAALRLSDSLGLAEYWVLNDVENPLMLKMSFIPPEGGFNGDTPLGLVQAGAGYAVVEIDF